MCSTRRLLGFSSFNVPSGNIGNLELAAPLAAVSQSRSAPRRGTPMSPVFLAALCLSDRRWRDPAALQETQNKIGHGRAGRLQVARGLV